MLSLSLVGLAVMLIGYLHGATGIDPVRGMVSDYVFTPIGSILLPVAVLVLAAGLMALRRALVAAGAAGRWTGALVAVAALGSALIGLFPADVTGAPVTTTGLVHKLAGGLLFGAVPVAALTLVAGSRRDRWRAVGRPLRWLAGISIVLFAGFLTSYLPLFGMPFPGGGALVGMQGLLERLVLAPELALVVVVAARLARPAAAATPVPVVADAVGAARAEVGR
ncbi:hypothetical protein Athai_24160 [Actinocatenispora thailandica]|uniref:DUF998 domain-containing protein n=1 Tax=Actinocatenispora thailandica TaxID=227318 RepID=A0A7R7HX96_9ACTN|nr:hypothetical protein Athai_24160 [Actinocatenispora thailandica]